MLRGQQPGASLINFNPSIGHVEAEFGVAAVQGYTLRINASQETGLHGGTVVQSLGLRAMACFPEFFINAAGSPGVDGSNGPHGIPGLRGASGGHGKDGYGPGRPGKPGKPGKDGKPGTAGKKGKKGENGTSGSRALNVHLGLSGEGLESLTADGYMERVVKQNEVPSETSDLAPSEPQLVREPLAIVHRLNTYSSQHPLQEVHDSNNPMRESPVVMIADGPRGAGLNFFSRNGVIFVCAHGGRGGNGGNGGNGGFGGAGGDGGNGGKGGGGKDGLKPGFSGENGGRGGDGGAGMAGGPGADGSTAGKGGNSGSGGHVTIETTNAKLLMLVEVDSRAGIRGKAGKPGLGGEGGRAGRGGLGGPGGRGGLPWDKLYLKRHHKYKYYYGCKPGVDGTLGRPGGLIGVAQAAHGLPGSTALDGKDAKDGQVTWILKSPEGELLEKAKDRFNCAVCQFRVRASSGTGIISPGSTIKIDKIIVWNNGGMTLPEGTKLSFAATGMLVSSTKDKKKVEILPALPKNKRHRCSSTFSMAVEKVEGPSGGAPFQALVSVAPVVELCGRTFSIAGQVLEVPVQYPIQIIGDVQFPHSVHQGSVVTLKLNIRNISARSYGQIKTSLGRVEAVVLFFLELEGGHRIDHRWRKELPEIGPRQDQTIEFDCRVDTNGQPYSILSVQVHLLLEGQSIEYRHLESRIIPVYGGADVDAVLVTDTDFKPGVYNLWKSILALLGLKCVFWDISWYRTYSLDDVPWLGKHRLVIFTHLMEDAALGHWLRTVMPHHVRALGGPQGIGNAAVIFVGLTTKDIARESVDWNSGEKLRDVSKPCAGPMCCSRPFSDEEYLEKAVLKASKIQRKLRACDSSPLKDYTPLVSPLKRNGVAPIPLLLFRETVPAMFRARAISVQMTEDPAGVELLASSPLLATNAAPADIYSGISSAIGGLITTQQRSSSPTNQRHRPAIALDGKYITLGLTLAGMIVSLPTQFRIDLLFRFASYPSSDLPVLSSSGIALPQVIGISFYNDLMSDWVSQRDTFPHGGDLVAEFDRAVITRGFLSVVEMESFVVPLTGGLVLSREDMKGFSPRKVRAEHTLKGMLKQMERTLTETRSVYIPSSEKVRLEYNNLRQTLPPWLFSHADEIQVIRVVEDDHGSQRKK